MFQQHVVIVTKEQSCDYEADFYGGLHNRSLCVDHSHARFVRVADALVFLRDCKEKHLMGWVPKQCHE